MCVRCGVYVFDVMFVCACLCPESKYPLELFDTD